MRVVPLVAVVSLASGCGGSSEPAKHPEPGPEASAPSGEGASGGSKPDTAAGEQEAAEPEAPKALPTECTDEGDVCTPPKEFVDRLCQDVYPNVALVMFRAGSPWSRGYLTRETKAWNAAGGASVAGSLAFDEEVLILEERESASGGMQVSGAGGGYQALRWNGACVTLSAGEVRFREPPRPKHAKIEWQWLQTPMREALRENEEITETYRARRGECRGVTMGAVSKKCERLTKKLSDVIVDHVRDGGELAEPEVIP